MARFSFVMTSHFFAGKHGAQICQAHARASQAPARTQACLLTGENSMIKRTPARPKALPAILEEKRDSRWQLILNHSVCSRLICRFGFFFFLEFSLVSLRQHHYFSQQEGPAQRNLAMSYKKGKGASPSASKTLVRPKNTTLVLSYLRKTKNKPVCSTLLKQKTRKIRRLLPLSTVRSIRNVSP